MGFGSWARCLELSRAGLLFINGAVIIGFSALNCDNQGWHGWVLAYRASDLQQVGSLATTSAAGWGGGVWASGKGKRVRGNNCEHLYTSGTTQESAATRGKVSAHRPRP